MAPILCFGEIAVKDNDGTTIIQEGDESRNEMTRWLRVYGRASTFVRGTGCLIQIPNLQPVSRRCA